MSDIRRSRHCILLIENPCRIPMHRTPDNRFLIWNISYHIQDTPYHWVQNTACIYSCILNMSDHLLPDGILLGKHPDTRSLRAPLASDITCMRKESHHSMFCIKDYIIYTFDLPYLHTFHLDRFLHRIHQYLRKSQCCNEDISKCLHTLHISWCTTNTHHLFNLEKILWDR